MNVCSSDVLSRGDIPSDWDPRSPVPVGGAPGAMGNGQYKTSGVEEGLDAEMTAKKPNLAGCLP